MAVVKLRPHQEVIPETGTHVYVAMRNHGLQIDQQGRGENRIGRKPQEQKRSLYDNGRHHRVDGVKAREGQARRADPAEAIRSRRGFGPRARLRECYGGRYYPQGQGGAVLHYLDGIVRKGILETYQPTQGMTGELLQLFEMKVDAAAAAITTLLNGWLKRGMKIHPDKMARQSEALLDSLFTRIR